MSNKSWIYLAKTYHINYFISQIPHLQTFNNQSLGVFINKLQRLRDDFKRPMRLKLFLSSFVESWQLIAENYSSFNSVFAYGHHSNDAPRTSISWHGKSNSCLKHKTVIRCFRKNNLRMNLIHGNKAAKPLKENWMLKRAYFCLNLLV